MKVFYMNQQERFWFFFNSNKNKKDLNKRIFSLWLLPYCWLGLDHNDGQFFRAMELLMFFLGHHCHQWFFNGFDKVGPSPLNVFLGVQPLEPMAFSKFWGQWSTMVFRLTIIDNLQLLTIINNDSEGDQCAVYKHANVGWAKFGL